jgi:filamentous hemagglutinin family protein
MNHLSLRQFRQTRLVVLLLLAGLADQLQLHANPTGGSVVQGTASFTAGSQFTINQTSGNALINWQGFNIGAGETTVFNQPSASSVTWNYISDSSASSINGNIIANGYVVLQNPNGFTVGGSAAITAHGLVMTTAATPPLDLSGGGSWSFDAPPPTAKIVNYGKINITGGGSAFLIANDIENNGMISAPGGKIGLYAGQKVLVSMAPDGRGLSAEVTLPQGSVDNNGQLIADAGSIVASAQFLNQGGLIQANSIRDVNGVIELIARDSLNLGVGSIISAQGDSQGISAGGTVVIKSGNDFSDQPGSTINIAGGAQGGNGGQVEISASQMEPIQSGIHGQAAAGFVGGILNIDPYNLTLDNAYVSSLNSQISGGLSQINLQADNNIELSTLWILANSSVAALLTLTAGNNIILDDGSAIRGGINWGLNLTAGTLLPSGTVPVAGNDGIYLNGNAYLQTQNGNLTLAAPNEVVVNGGAIRTLAGGNIGVTTQYGDVNTGNSVNGYLFGQRTAPYYKVDAPNLGGISTAAGGNVTITAGGDVISYLPVQSDYNNAQFDGGTGAFGSLPGNVTITAGANVYGHYVVANGIGTITAGGCIGAPTSILANDPTKAFEGFALSLTSGSWGINAPNGNIYVQDVRNPNGIFGERSGSSAVNYAGYHYFNYDLNSSVALNAGGSVEITGYDAPHSPPSSLGSYIPLILPPTLSVTTGSGDFTLDESVILFPSPDQNLNLFIGGSLVGVPNGNPINLEMSDSASTRWTGDSSFGTGEHAPTPPEINNPNPVEIQVAGNLENLNLYTTKQTQISVGGDVINAGFVGQNLHSGDVTSLNVGGQIYNSPLFTFALLTSGIISANPLQPGLWDSVFLLAVDPSMVAQLISFNANTAPGANGLADYLKSHNYLLFPSGLGSGAYGSNPGFLYDPSSLQLAFKGNMMSLLSSSQIAALEGGTMTVLVADSQGNPVIDANGHLEVRTYTFSAATAIASLYNESQVATTTEGLGFLLGGPGQFNINARSIDLGFSPGIISYGFGGRYSTLEDVTGTSGLGGAAINVNVSGNLNLLTSAITSIDGGNVTVNAGGAIDLGKGNFDFQTSDCYGIYTSGYSDVKVTAIGDINVGGGCIATFNGGNVFVESFNGNVSAGNGANKALFVYTIYPDPNTGLPVFGTIGDLTDPASLQVDPTPYGNGILAEFPILKYQWPGGKTQPGNITVATPAGNIVSSRGGISQIALNSTIGGGPTVTLTAGTPGTTATPDQGNISLGLGGVVGGTINVTAQGTVEGLIVSQHDANINAAQSFNGTVLSGGSANFGGAGSISGTVVGIGGINTGSSSLGGATLLSQNVSSGGASQSTLGTSASATSASQSAAQQSSQTASEQVTSNNNEDDDQKKKKKPQVRKVGRITVILSAATPAQ